MTITQLVIHFPIDGLLGYFQFGAIWNKAAINILDQSFLWLHSFLLDICIGREQLDHRVDECLTWLETHKYLSNLIFITFPAPTSIVYEGQLLCVLISPSYCQSFNFSHFHGVKWYFTVVLILIFPIVLIQWGSCDKITIDSIA